MLWGIMEWNGIYILVIIQNEKILLHSFVGSFILWILIRNGCWNYQREYNYNDKEIHPPLLRINGKAFSLSISFWYYMLFHRIFVWLWKYFEWISSKQVKQKVESLKTQSKNLGSHRRRIWNITQNFSYKKEGTKIRA